MGEMDREKRRYRRFHLTDVRGNLLLSLDARIRDISLSGMALESSSRLDPHRNYSFRLGSAEAPVRVTGTVVWCYLQGTRRLDSGEVVPVYQAGVRFQDVLSEGARDLQRFLAENAIITVETRLFGRFSVREGQTVRLDSAAEFQTLAISGQGMRVRTATPVESDATCDVEMELNGDSLRLACQVERVSPAPEPYTGAYDLSLSFVDLEPAQHAEIEAWVARHLARSEERDA
ncbi:MAG: Flagellar brake protein YcgR [Acidobacteria bacterium ADurb.Bin051]|jgi:c-di-GMP-binding flagellar brake protein YcgR|nr:MAG: Flagellar brake protein YcgR [Acidobacteria bacterium ADurb.Bin051]